ncbi:hypothetical protein HanRHA438_Chr08g0355411 [Helianthus annuus]|nr:hypothetical protein HanRHA438_Chr08g0355411 [Helianthus annuus]
MAKKPEPGVYPKPETNGTGMGLVLKIFAGMGLGDTRPHYPKPHTRLPELYTRLFYLYLYFPLTIVYFIYFSMFSM